MEPLTSLLGAFGGSVVGAVSAHLTKRHEAKVRIEEAKIQYARDKMLNEHELRMHEAKMQMHTMEQEYKGLTESFKMDAATYASAVPGSKLMLIVDFVRGLVRPVLTATLLIYCMVTLFYLTKHYDVQLAQNEVYELVSILIHNLVTCTGIALAWWFGSRPEKRK